MNTNIDMLLKNFKYSEQIIETPKSKIPILVSSSVIISNCISQNIIDVKIRIRDKLSGILWIFPVLAQSHLKKQLFQYNALQQFKDNL